MIETDLYFGMSKPDGSIITNKEWSSFKENNISVVFKNGCTIIDVQGNWRDLNNGKLISEPTHLVVYYHKNSRNLSKQIDSLREEYKIRFNQQSILRVDRKVSVSF